MKLAFSHSRRKPCRLIVCEKTGRWAAAVRRVLQRLTVQDSQLPRVHEVRSWNECRDELSQSPASFVLLEATLQNAAETAERIRWLDSEYRQARCVVIAAYGAEPMQWLFREAGAVDVVFGPRDLRRVVMMFERHWSTVPEIELNWRESIWHRLPWQNASVRV